MTKLIKVGIMVFALMLIHTASSESAYQSITEIKASTPARWRETYQTPWRKIAIDVNIRVPDVSRFPVLRVTMIRPVDERLLADYKYVNRNQNGMLEANFHGPSTIVQQDWKLKSSVVFLDGTVPDILPENSSLSYEAATEFIFGEFQRLYGLGREDFSIWKAAINSAFYRYSGSGANIVWKERVTDTGRYLFTFRQQFDGIPYQPALECYDPQHYKKGSEKHIRNGLISAQITDTEHFRIVSQLMEQVDRVHEDIPILPFDQAKAAFEAEIMAGRLRSIDSLELCYIPYVDPKDDKIFWLLPAWYLKGGYTRNPKREFTPFLHEDTGDVLDDGIERAELVFQAQLGSLLDYTDKRPSRRTLPKIIAWQDVK
ncbi:MAG: hypothetical protein ACOX6Y_10310 [Christensenellales bacterium]|jgi:hypothetical protein